MAFETISWDGEFARFWRGTFNSMQCPPTPRTPDELQLAPRIALQNWDGGKLYQNLFGLKEGVSRLPADTAERRAKGALVPSDAPHLRSAGLEHEAQQMENWAAELQDLKMQQDAEMSRKEFLAGQKMYREAQGHLGKVNDGAAAQARREWGITEVPN